VTPGKTRTEGLYLPAGLNASGSPRMRNVAVERDVWVSLLGLLPLRPDPGLSG